MKRFRSLNVLVVHDFLAPWRLTDLGILRSRYRVKTVEWRGTGSWLRLLPALRTADAVFFWFITDYTLPVMRIAAWLKKKTVLITGGYDVAYEPNIAYGAMLSPGVRHRNVRVLQLADLVVPFSRFSAAEVSRWACPRRMEVIYVGAIDTETYKPSFKEPNLVISGGWIKRSNLSRKGHENFVRAASFCPGVRFVLVGKELDETGDYLRSIAPANFSIVNDERRIEYFQRAKVYVQISAHEGFGISVAEAMSCGCLPVVSNAGSLPEVVGDTGYYVPVGNPEATAKAVSLALGAPCDASTKARERIIKNFPIERRTSELHRAIDALFDKHPHDKKV